MYVGMLELSLYSVVSEIKEKLKILKNSLSNFKWIDENGFITIKRAHLHNFAISQRYVWALNPT